MRKDEFDWNAVKIWNADGDDVPLSPDKWMGNSRRTHYEAATHADVKSVTTVTGNLEKAICAWLKDADFAFCCFAWLTNFLVLDALAALSQGCQIVVQKEDFLRPDSNHNARSHKILRSKYAGLRCGFNRMSLPSIAGHLSCGSDDLVEAVRCAGVANTDRRIAAPRMHHKFAVACKCNVVEEAECWGVFRRVEFFPYSVWTGSFNPTCNGARSRENAVIVNSESAANHYVNEWAKVFAISESLDWNSAWSAPEWRIGT